VRSFRSIALRKAILLSLSISLTLSMDASCQQPLPAGSVQGVVTVEGAEASAKGIRVFLRPIVAPVSQLPYEYVIRDDDSRRADRYSVVDGDGAYVIANVPSGDYTFLVYKPGYLDNDAVLVDSAGFAEFGRKVHLNADEHKTMDIRLIRGGVIQGQVLYDDGGPADSGKRFAGAVAVNAEIETAPGRFSRFGEAAHTDAKGYYNIEGLPAGRYRVFAALNGGMVTTTRGMEGASGQTVFAPSVVRASKAKVIHVQQMQTTNRVDVVLPTLGLHVVKGRVVDSTDAPVTEGLIRLYPTGEPDLSKATPVDKNGGFSFSDVPDEEYTIRYESFGTTEFLGMTPDNTGVRMRLNKAPFAPVTEDIRVSGQNPEPVLLRVKPMP
jgi:hypothetical protein